MSKMHLKQPGFTYRACGPVAKNKERIHELKKTGDRKYIYINEQDKACFQHDMAYGELISRFNIGTRFSLCVIDIFSKDEGITSLKDKKVQLLLMLFKNFRQFNEKAK